MSFSHNTNQQMNIFDPYYGLTEREKKFLKDSWAETFSKEIFPLINEDRFSVLYSENPATRPNNPVNVYMGSLMLREMFTQTDDETFKSILFDVRYQYALHTTSFEEQPLSKNSLTNFRCMNYEYYLKTGRDLIQEEIESHAKVFSEKLNIDGKMIRLDSMMISSACRKLSRLEIVFSCLQRLIKEISDTDASMMPDKYKIYLKEEHRNEIIYRTRDTVLDERLKAVIEDAVAVYELFKNTNMAQSQNFNLLERMLCEQTVKNGEATEPIPSKEISSESLQNPTDPDATFRRKGSKNNIGYVANVVETFDDDNAIITSYDLQKNTYSDQQFSKDTIDKLGKQDEKLTAVVDGAYYSEDISNKAEENNIEIIPTGLVGRVSKNNLDYAGFFIDEEAHVVLNCREGHKPLESKYKKDKGIYTIKFFIEDCSNCPHGDKCPVKKQKKYYYLRLSEKKFHREKLIERMGAKDYKDIADKRAGIEGIPSVLRRRYKIDHLPVRGLVRTKLHFGFKISAVNCKRFIKAMKTKGKDPLNSFVFNHLLEVLSFQRTFFQTA